MKNAKIGLASLSTSDILNIELVNFSGIDEVEVLYRRKGSGEAFEELGWSVSSIVEEISIIEAGNY